MKEVCLIDFTPGSGYAPTFFYPWEISVFHCSLQQKICGWVYFIKWCILSCGIIVCFVLWVTHLPSSIYWKLLILHVCVDIAVCHCWCQLERIWSSLFHVVAYLYIFFVFWVLCFKLRIIVGNWKILSVTATFAWLIFLGTSIWK